jgi:hypothetical protein
MRVHLVCLNFPVYLDIYLFYDIEIFTSCIGYTLLWQSQHWREHTGNVTTAWWFTQIPVRMLGRLGADVFQNFQYTCTSKLEGGNCRRCHHAVISNSRTALCTGYASEHAYVA